MGWGGVPVALVLLGAWAALGVSSPVGITGWPLFVGGWGGEVVYFFWFALVMPTGEDLRYSRGSSMKN